MSQSFCLYAKVLIFAPLLRKARAFSSAGSEHLPYKQRVGGSNPSTPTTNKGVSNEAPLFIAGDSPTFFYFANAKGRPPADLGSQSRTSFFVDVADSNQGLKAPIYLFLVR